MYRGEFRSGKNHHIRAKNVHPAARRMSEGSGAMWQLWLTWFLVASVHISRANNIHSIKLEHNIVIVFF